MFESVVFKINVAFSTTIQKTGDKSYNFYVSDQSVSQQQTNFVWIKNDYLF